MTSMSVRRASSSSMRSLSFQSESRITRIAKAPGDKKVIWNRRLEQMRFELRRQSLLRMVVGSAEPEAAMLIVGDFDQSPNQRLARQQPVHLHLAEDGDP